MLAETTGIAELTGSLLISLISGNARTTIREASRARTIISTDPSSTQERNDWLIRHLDN